MPSVVLSNEVAQPRTDVNVIVQDHNAQSNEMKLWFTRDADWLAIVKQKPVSALTVASEAPLSKGRCELDRKVVYLSDINSSCSKE